MAQFDGDTRKVGLLGAGLGKAMRNKRYIFWFWMLNLTLAEFGTSAFRRSAHAILDHSSYSQGLLQGFDLSVMIDLFIRPEFGTMEAASTPAFYFAFLFFLATTIFLPGVFQGYASTYRLPREDFFRACGRNLWRFIRLLFISGIIMLIVTIPVFILHGVLERKAAESTYELLAPAVRYGGLLIIFLIMAVFRIWFDLAEADIVLNDQRAVRKSIAAAFRHSFRSLGRLLVSYVITTIVAAIFLVGGIWLWMRIVPSESVLGGFLMGQLILLLLLIPRFWQRGIVVSYWQQYMLVPEAPPIVVTSPPAPVVPQPVPLIPTPINPGAGTFRILETGS